MNNFNEMASTWDKEPRRIERARVVADEIRKSISGLQNMKAMEYGCGTGLLSFELQPYLKSIVLADNSEGMLKVLAEKIDKCKADNMKPIFADLSESNINDSFDIIYTLMTLHHIVNTDKIILSFRDLLNESGYLCIADLVEEDGSFHGDGFVGHNGFNKEYLTGILKRQGFRVVSWKVCYDNIKKFDDGTEKVFPLFVLIAQKITDK